MSSVPGQLCFVLMPFGKKPDANGTMIDFDAVYQDIIKPAVAEAELDPLRADEEQTGGIIHKPMFERLILCPYAIADLTTANANVFYELGVRHAARPSTTALLFAEGGRLPFDVNLLRAQPYAIGGNGKPSDPAPVREALKQRLLYAQKIAREDKPAPDSPIYQLLENFNVDIARLKTDLFRDLDYARKQKAELETARRKGVDALVAFENALPPLDRVETGVVIDLFLSYRGAKQWQRMIDLATRMPAPLRETVMVQEQLALALNRAGRGEEAEQVLLNLLKARGPSSETYGILGRVYKDRWDKAREGSAFLAKGLLDKAIDAYRKGFETDPRDAYPGINCVTLMELRNPPDERRAEMLPVVTYAVKRRIAAGEPDYWDHATLVELAVLRKDEAAASDALGNALAAMREKWEGESTANNLRLIVETREKRGEDGPAWVRDVVDALGA